MQYYIKFYNENTSEFVGYYKETGIGCITRLPKGTKYFNNLEEALSVLDMVDNSFLRDIDGHYYTGKAFIYGDANRIPTKDVYKRLGQGDEREDELKAFIRKNSNNYRR